MNDISEDEDLRFYQEWQQFCEEVELQDLNVYLNDISEDEDLRFYQEWQQWAELWEGETWWIWQDKDYMEHLSELREETGTE